MAKTTETTFKGQIVKYHRKQQGDRKRNTGEKERERLRHSMEISASITVPVDSTQEFLNAKFDMF